MRHVFETLLLLSFASDKFLLNFCLVSVSIFFVIVTFSVFNGCHLVLFRIHFPIIEKLKYSHFKADN